MYDHIGLRVKDLDASTRFYEAVLAPLGHVLASRDETGAGLGPQGAPALWLTLPKQEKNTGTHVAFRAKDRASVDRFHAAGLRQGQWRPRSAA
jgi:catechol 2,3-dioxygenase-like lactoylglutathione lyase family enzyme